MRQYMYRLYKIATRLGSKAMSIEDAIPKIVKSLTLVAFIFAITALGYWFLRDKNLAIMQPQGTVGLEQRKLIYIGLALSAVVVLPVFFMAFYIYNKFKETNTNATYQPEWDHNTTIETIWWTVPVLIIGVLSVLTWTSSHKLDPYKRIVSDKPVLKIQVIALDWKWLFLYPDQRIATLNYVQIPVDTPVDFEITSDAPMNSLWVPQLGSQIYAMSGMTTHLNVQATKLGVYDGSSANISGKGFSGMKFKVHTTTPEEFSSWSQGISGSRPIFDAATYDELAKQSEDEPAQTYSLADMGLYDRVIDKYMGPMEMRATDNSSDGTMDRIHTKGHR